MNNSSRSSQLQPEDSIDTVAADRVVGANEPKQAQTLLQASEQRYVSLAETVPVGIFRTDVAGNAIYLNNCWCKIAGLSPEAAAGSGWILSLHPEDREQVAAEWYRATQENHQFQMEYRFLRSDGKVTWVYGQAEAELDAQGQIIGYVGTLTDISTRKQAEIQLELQNALLAKVANNEPLVNILNLTIEAVEKILYGAICSVLLLDSENRLRLGAAPSLDPAYNQIIEGIAIGEGVGSCGTAAFRNQTIIVTNIATDPLWQDYKEYPLQYGLQACWSSPINSSTNQVLGTFAVYYHQTRSPQPHELKLIAQMANIVGIAIERQQAEHQLQTLIEGTAATTGKDYFPALVSHIAAALNVSYVLLTEKIDDKLSVLAFWANDSLQSTFAFPVADTPCQQALQQGQYYCNSLVQARFPAALNLVAMAAESYLGIALQDVRGNAIGSLCILDQNPIKDPHKAENLLRVFGARAAAELERERADKALAQLNQELEQRVLERTAALQKSEQRYRALMNGASDAIILADAQGYLIEGNQASEALLGYSRTELSHLHLSEIHPPEVFAAAQAAFRDLLVQDQISPIFETIVLRKDGSQVPVEIKGICIEVDGEQIVQGIFRDISQRKQMEFQLAESEAKFRRLVEGGKDFFWSVDLDGLFTYLSPQFKYMLGWDPDEWIGKSFANLVHPEDLGLVGADHKNVELGQKHHYPEFRHLHRDGHYIWARVSAAPTIDSAGEIVGIQGLLVDVTERKQAELALEREALRRNAVFNASSDGIHIMDRDGNLIEANDRFAQMLGYTPAEIVGFTVFDWDARWSPEALAEAIENDSLDNTTFETIHRRKDGSIFPVEISRQVMAWQGESFLVNISRDISERQQAEIALQESLYFTRKIADTSPNILYIYDIQGQYNVYVNRAIEKILGYTTAEIQAMGASLFQTLLHPDDFSRVPAQYAKIGEAQDGDILEFEYRMRHANGEWRWLMGQDSVFSRDAQGHVQQTIGTAQDITETKHEELTRKQAEDLICQQAERAILLKEITQRIRQSLDLQSIFDTACQEIRDIIEADRVGIFKFDPASHFDDGEFVAESVGAEFTSAIKIRVKDHCFGENYAALYAKGRSYVVNDIYQNGDVICHTNILAQFQVRANLVMPLLCGDNLWGLLCIHQCAAPRNWQQSDIDLTHQIANQLTIAIQQANLFEQVQQELAQKQQAEVKLTETNHQLAVSNQELLRATRLKDEFLANMSHELRTPLNAILGLSESFLEEVFGAINDRQQKAITTVERSGQHLLSLINDILEVSKIEAGKLELEIKTVSATTLTNSTLAFVKQLAHQKQIQLTTTFAPNLGNIDVDERRIRQVLINLLNNAVKFTPAGGRVTLEVQLEQAAFCPLPTSPDLRQQLDSGAWILFAVTDTGIGITPENQSRLFKPFVQIDGSLNRHYQGTGLGLTLVKQIVELHGGSVSLASEFGKGSCFTVRLPYHAAAEQRTILSPEPTTSLSITDGYLPSIAYPLILLAEDNQDNIDTLSSYLEACNYRMMLASNGHEAISILESRLNTPADLPDLILMDIQMPGMDGLETMQRIRHDLQLVDLPIIALTALAMTGDREKCLAAGANDYLTKPIKLKQLRENIQRLIPMN